MLLDLIALWLSAIVFVCMTVFAGIQVRADAYFVQPVAEKWAGRAILIALAVLALFVLTAAVL